MKQGVGVSTSNLGLTNTWVYQYFIVHSALNKLDLAIPSTCSGIRICNEPRALDEVCCTPRCIGNNIIILFRRFHHSMSYRHPDGTFAVSFDLIVSKHSNAWRRWFRKRRLSLITLKQKVFRAVVRAPLNLRSENQHTIWRVKHLNSLNNLELGRKAFCRAI